MLFSWGYIYKCCQIENNSISNYLSFKLFVKNILTLDLRGKQEEYVFAINSWCN